MAELLPVPQKGFRERVRGLFSLRKLPGIGITLFGLVWQAAHGGWILLDWAGRASLFLDAVKSMGGDPAVIASVVNSPFFGVGLIVVGIGYVVFVGEPHAGVQRHAWWPYVGWGFFTLCAIVVLLTVGYGAFVIAAREEGAKIALGIPRGAPGENSPTHPQTPLFSGKYSLQPDQIRILILEFAKLLPDISPVVVVRVELDVTGITIYSQLVDALTRSGVGTSLGFDTPHNPNDEGLMLIVGDPNNVPPDAEKIREAFVVANVPLKVIPRVGFRVPTSTDRALGQYRIFVGPQPLSWR